MKESFGPGDARKQRFLREMVGDCEGEPKASWIDVIACVAMLLLAVLAFSAQANDRPAIDQLHFESATRLLRIEGRNFRLPVKLLLNGHPEPLVVVEVKDRQIRALMPAGFGDGSYSLLFVHGESSEEREELSLTIGPVGPYLNEKH